MKLILLSFTILHLSTSTQLASPLIDFSNDLKISLTNAEITVTKAATIVKALKSLSSDADFKNLCKLVDTQPKDLYSAYSSHLLASNANCDEKVEVETEKILKYAKTDSGNSNVPNLFYRAWV